jgi:DNA-binding NarL/FixJ family response regulator
MDASRRDGCVQIGECQVVKNIVLIADAQRMCRDGIRALLEQHTDFGVVAVDDGARALDAVRERVIDIAVLSTNLNGPNSIEVIERVQKERKRTRCILLMATGRRHDVERSLRAGAGGCVAKADSIEVLVDAIKSVRKGNAYVSTSLTPYLVDGIRSSGTTGEPAALLTPRECEVLQEIAEGKTSKEIAAEWNVSPKTIECHRTRLMRKLGIHKASSLVRFAIEQGLVRG